MKFLVAAAALLMTMAVVAAPLNAQSTDFEPPRLSNGNPDLNGIWQAIGSAHYDIEPHIARHAMALREGPPGPLPAAEVVRLGAV
ncbi:MAG: hypothetical protein OXH75_27105, partial [Acidobacteria bacterium]|nr:hypothetical protein [Acidobacteriota bacterium]